MILDRLKADGVDTTHVSEVSSAPTGAAFGPMEGVISPERVEELIGR